MMIGCLCIHGFTGAPYEIEPLASYLETNTDWVIKTFTLPGHGESLSLSGISYNEWIEASENELKELLIRCEKVYIIGFSMGGMIAGHLAVNYPASKLVLLSAAAYYVNPKQLISDVKEMVGDAFRGKLKGNELFLRYQKKINGTPMKATMEFQKLVKELRPSLKDISIPTLVVQGECDGIVPVKSAEYIFETISSSNKELYFLPESQHHVCHGNDKDELFTLVLHFLKK